MRSRSPADAALAADYSAADSAEEIALFAVILRILLPLGDMEPDIVIERLLNLAHVFFRQFNFTLGILAAEIETEGLGYNRLNIFKRDLSFLSRKY